jgi:MFS family permease
MGEMVSSCCSPRVLLIAFAAFLSSISTGIIFGWAGLVTILRDEGQYSAKCDGDDSNCPARDAAFASIFATAAVANYASFFPAGVALDELGPRTTAVFGVLCVASGSALLAVSDSNPGGFDGFTLALSLQAVGSPFVHLSWFNFSALVPSKRAMITSLAVACFAGSGLLYVVIWGIIDSGGGAITRRGVLFTHCGLLSALAIVVSVHRKHVCKFGPNDRHASERTIPLT